MRCAVCDSTEFHDTLKDLGHKTKLLYFVPQPDGSYHCNRCEEAIQEVRDENNDKDEMLLGW